MTPLYERRFICHITMKDVNLYQSLYRVKNKWEEEKEGEAKILAEERSIHEMIRYKYSKDAKR